MCNANQTALTLARSTLGIFILREDGNRVNDTPREVVHESFDDETVTRGKKNKTFKNLCVQRNVSIGGNLCVAGKALYKSGIAFALTGSLTITAPLNVTSVQGENASFASGTVGTVTVSNVFGITNMTGSAHPAGSYPLFYNPTTGILYCNLN